MVKIHWYKYPPSNIYGTMCGRKITEKTNIDVVEEKTTCKKCKEAIKKAKRRREQREMNLTLGI